MDKIIIKNLEVFANHGVFQEEKKLGQKFVLDITLHLNLKNASKTDDLTKSVHYGEICSEVSDVLKKNTYDLIETAADEVAKHILLNHSLVKKCTVMLKKPFAPIGIPLEYASVEISRSIHEVYISIGSNMGDKKSNLEEAVKRLQSFSEISVNRVSKFIETKPWGYENQDIFLNGALKISTIFEPEELMETLLFVEKEMKRERKVKWGPRIIDLDVIFFDDLVTSSDFLTLPHPLMEEREFVLKPLCEIAPNKVHPILKERVFRLLDKLTNK